MILSFVETWVGVGAGVETVTPNGVAVRISDFIPEPISFTAFT